MGHGISKNSQSYTSPSSSEPSPRSSNVEPVQSLALSPPAASSASSESETYVSRQGSASDSESSLRSAGASRKAAATWTEAAPDRTSHRWPQRNGRDGRHEGWVDLDAGHADKRTEKCRRKKPFRPSRFIPLAFQDPETEQTLVLESPGHPRQIPGPIGPLAPYPQATDGRRETLGQAFEAGLADVAEVHPVRGRGRYAGHERQLVFGTVWIGRRLPRYSDGRYGEV